MKFLTTLLSILLSLTLFSQKEMYEICPIKNSEEVPNVNLKNTKGETINLKKYIGKAPVVVIFYRGAWCPYCTRHLSALQEVKPQVDSLGFKLIAITPDNFTKLDSTKSRTKGLEYQLLSDQNLEAINAFGIGWKINDELYKKYKDSYGMDSEWWSGSKHHVLPVPAVFIIKDGKIQYQHVDPNYSNRLEPKLLLNLLKTVK
ncbi:MAG: peroxiredoxin-like family protein [Vicingaceae bacterium]|nr:peroxiredoxin-like family protein [Vicingaceae bacterium]